MSALLNPSSVVYLPSVVDENFLKSTAETLAQLCSESEVRGHPLLASLLAIAKGEAEDDLRTLTRARHLMPDEQDPDDGAALMAQKLACRGDQT